MARRKRDGRSLSLRAFASAVAAITLMAGAAVAQPTTPEPRAAHDFASATRAPAQVSCLWSALHPLIQLRIETSIRTDGELPSTVIERLGAAGLARHLNRCGFEFDDANLALAARYWIARATLTVYEAEARFAGLDLTEADAALDITAPDAARPGFARRIMAGRDTRADLAIRAAIDTLRALGRRFDPPARRLLAEYMTARLLADGMSAGARPPVKLEKF